MYWNRLNDVLRARYGTKVYKLALSSGCSCPNRDGTLGTRGCIFCDGAGAFAAAGEISRQLTDARNRVAAKAGAGGKVHRLFSVLHQHLWPGGASPAAVSGGDGAGGCGDPLRGHPAGLFTAVGAGAAGGVRGGKGSVGGVGAPDHPSRLRGISAPGL